MRLLVRGIRSRYRLVKRHHDRVFYEYLRFIVAQDDGASDREKHRERKHFLAQKQPQLNQSARKKLINKGRLYRLRHVVQVEDGMLKGLPFGRGEVAPMVAEHFVVPWVLAAMLDLIGPGADCTGLNMAAVENLWQKFAVVNAKWLYKEARNFITLAKWLLSEWMHCAYKWICPADTALS